MGEMEGWIFAGRRFDVLAYANYRKRIFSVSYITRGRCVRES